MKKNDGGGGILIAYEHICDSIANRTKRDNKGGRRMAHWWRLVAVLSVSSVISFVPPYRCDFDYLIDTCIGVLT